MIHIEHTVDGPINLCKKETSDCWKGLASIFIMLGHICPNNTPVFIRFFLSGNLWVGLFFFYSGYGLQYSLEYNRNYINKKILFLGKRLLIRYIKRNSKRREIFTIDKLWKLG